MSSRRKRITVISFSPIHGDARVLRQLQYLAERFDVTAVGYGQSILPVKGVTMIALRQPGIPISRVLRTGAALVIGKVLPEVGYARWYRDRAEYAEALEAVVRSRPDAIVANDWDALPAACFAARRSPAPIVLDLHEYAPRHFENRGYWKLLIGPMVDHHLRTYLPQAARIVTVNESLARMYERTYGIECGVVRNIPLGTARPDFHATDRASVRLVHHGIAVPDRKLEIMVDTMALLEPRFSLHFMLVAKDAAYLERLRNHAARVAPGRVHFHRPVAPGEIVRTIADYDIGLFVLPPVNFNYEHALPNKYFEFIHAGLAVCTGPSVEMALLTRRYGCGVVAPTNEPLDAAKVLNSLSADAIDAYKLRSIAARAELTPDREVGKLVQLVDDVIADREGRS